MLDLLGVVTVDVAAAATSKHSDVPAWYSGA
jgi:hypothetical protein